MISVLTVTHDRKNSAERFITSLVAADGFEKLEVLILINGDDEASLQLMQRYSSQYRNIQSIKSQNKQRREARNLLIKESNPVIVILKRNDTATCLFSRIVFQ